MSRCACVVRGAHAGLAGLFAMFLAGCPGSAARPDNPGPSIALATPPAIVRAADVSNPPVADASDPCPEATQCPPPPSGTVIREYPRSPAAATFEVTSSAAIIWAYAPEPTTARIELETRPPPGDGGDAGFQRISTHRLRLRESTGNADALEIEDLEPDRRYRYRLQFGNGNATDWYHFRTAPARTADVPVHFLVSAEVSNAPGYGDTILTTMRKSGAAFFLSLGDWPYTDVPIKDIELDQYRATHREARLKPGMTRLLQAMSVYAIYDDHEIRDNWDEQFRQEEPDRFIAGVTAWDEFFPMRGNRDKDLVKRRRYRRVRWGKHAELFILDTRMYRSAYRDPDGPHKTMLGAEQLAWLKKSLRASSASFKIVVSTVPLDFGTTPEHWSAYATERHDLLSFLHASRLRGVVFLTADQHWFAVHHHGTGLKEFQVGPMQSFLRTMPRNPPPEVVFRESVANYGEIIITGGRRPRLVFTARDPDGRLIYSEVLSRERIRKAPVPPPPPATPDGTSQP